MNTSTKTINKTININNKNVLIIPRTYLFEEVFKLPFDIEKKDLLKWIKHKFSKDLPFSSDDFIYSYKLSDIKDDNSRDCLVYAILKNNFKQIIGEKDNSIIIEDNYIPLPFIETSFEKKDNILNLIYYADELIVLKYNNNNLSSSRSLKLNGKNKSDINNFLAETKKHFEIKFAEQLNVSSELYCLLKDENNDFSLFDDMNIKILKNHELNIDFNNTLILEDVLIFSERSKNFYNKLRYFIFSLLIIIFFILYVNSYISNLKNKYAEISSRIEKLEKEKIKNLNIFNKKRFIVRASLSVKILLNALNELYKNLPANTHLYQFIIRKNGEFIIKGSTKTTIVNFVQSIEKTNYFKNVSIKDLSRKQNTGDVDFQIIGIINLWENKL